jgi:hypothetical protein
MESGHLVVALLNFYDNDQCNKVNNMPPLYSSHLQSYLRYSSVFFFAGFDSTLPTSSLSSQSFVHTDVSFLPIETYKLSCTFISLTEIIPMVATATPNIHKLHPTHEWQIVTSKNWFPTHVPKYKTPALFTIFSFQETYLYQTSLLLCMVIINALFFRWSWYRKKYLSYILAYTWQTCQISLNYFCICVSVTAAVPYNLNSQ